MYTNGIYSNDAQLDRKIHTLINMVNGYTQRVTNLEAIETRCGVRFAMNGCLGLVDGTIVLDASVLTTGTVSITNSESGEELEQFTIEADTDDNGHINTTIVTINSNVLTLQGGTTLTIPVGTTITFAITNAKDGSNATMENIAYIPSTIGNIYTLTAV